jgi:hypothetical protein
LGLVWASTESEKDGIRGVVLNGVHILQIEPQKWKKTKKNFCKKIKKKVQFSQIHTSIHKIWRTLTIFAVTTIFF